MAFCFAVYCIAHLARLYFRLVLIEKQKTVKTVDALKSEHLSKKVKPIIACLDTRESESFNHFLLKHGVCHDNMKVMENVEYNSSRVEAKEKGYKTAGACTYIISAINNRNKFTKQLINCTGVLAVGISKETGENISFLTHENPNKFLNWCYSLFVEDFREQLVEIKKICFDKTIDAVIMGGNHYRDIRGEENDKKHREDYRESIILLSEEIKDILGFEPAVITGPKIVPNGDDIFFDNDNRRLYIFRPAVGDISSEWYLPGNYDVQESKWMVK